MKKFVFVFALCAFAIPAFAQSPTRKAPQQRLPVASRDFTITNFGAVGDGQVATDCSIISGANHIVCQGSRFVASDVGKVFALYGAGQLRNGYPQPLAGVITGIVSANEAVISVAAVSAVTNAERFVWGTNNTVAIQSAVDAAADAGGDVFAKAGVPSAGVVNGDGSQSFARGGFVSSISRADVTPTINMTVQLVVSGDEAVEILNAAASTDDGQQILVNARRKASRNRVN